MPEVTFEAGARVSMAMPVDWMVRGFIRAVDRCETAANAPGERIARDLAIALFEAGAWIDSLCPRLPELEGKIRVKGFQFVRNRTHHQYAAAVRFEDTRVVWVCQDSGFFPAAPPPHENEALGRSYKQSLENRPVIETLRHLVKLVERHVVEDRRFID